MTAGATRTPPDDDEEDAHAEGASLEQVRRHEGASPIEVACAEARVIDANAVARRTADAIERANVAIRNPTRELVV